MTIITDEDCIGYHQPGHPERPERISRTQQRLSEQDELSLTWIEAVAASEEAIHRAHPATYVQRLEEPCDFDADTSWFPEIARYAVNSAGAALQALQLSRAGETVFSLMRPPGHHAMSERAMGFCYLNNVAIAALEALATGVKRVAIFDFDVHHGNGTESILLNRERTAVFSVHQSPCYPGTGTRNLGNNSFNFPVPPSTPRNEYRTVLTRALEQLKQFKPALVGVSAGFDAYVHDPLAQETLEDEDFYWMGDQLRRLGIPVFSVLEGGYSHDLPELILAYLKGLAGK